MAFSLEEFKAVCQLLKDNHRDQVVPSDDFDQLDLEAFNFFVSVTTNELVPFILYPIIQLAEAGSGELGVGDEVIREVETRRTTLTNLLTKNKPIEAQFKKGLKNTNIAWPESNLDVWATIFSNSILRIIDYESWSKQ